MNIGSIYRIDGRIYKLAAYDLSTFVFHTLGSLPAFRIERSTQLVEEIAKNEQEFFQKAAILISGDTPIIQWTFARWRNEVEEISTDVFEELLEEIEEQNFHPKDDRSAIDQAMNRIAKDCVFDSDWYAHADAKLKAIEFSNSALDVSSDDILVHCPKHRTTNWLALRDATFMAYFISDICKSVVEKLEDYWKEGEGE